MQRVRAITITAERHSTPMKTNSIRNTAVVRTLVLGAIWLAALREVYYQGLQGQEDQVRRLRHDLRNHLTALQGLLARGQTGAADGYLEQLLDSEALHGRRRL